MPIEIRELLIKAAIGNSTNLPNSQNGSTMDFDRVKKEIVKEVTENVLRTIQLKLER